MRAVCQLKHANDVVQVLRAFGKPEQLRFSGQLLQMLMNVTPYPMPVRPAAAAEAHMEEEESIPYVVGASLSSDALWHEGPLTFFNVDLPAHARRWERNTDWSEVKEFASKPPSAAFARMLDQLCLGSRYLGAHEKTFPPLLGVAEALPLSKLGVLSAKFAPDVALQILEDWGVMLRQALSRLPAPVLAALKSGERVHVSRALMQTLYEQAALEFWVQRLGYDKLLSAA
jgi:hypothetical protein